MGKKEQPESRKYVQLKIRGQDRHGKEQTNTFNRISILVLVFGRMVNLVFG